VEGRKKRPSTPSTTPYMMYIILYIYKFKVCFYGVEGVEGKMRFIRKNFFYFYFYFIYEFVQKRVRTLHTIKKTILFLSKNVFILYKVCGGAGGSLFTYLIIK